MALKWLLTIINPNAKFTRWSLLILTFDFEIQHRVGKKMSDVDCLSRPVLAVIQTETNDEEDDETNDEDNKKIYPWEDS